MPQGIKLQTSFSIEGRWLVSGQGGGLCHVRAVDHGSSGLWFVSCPGGGSCQGDRVTYRL